MTRSTARTTSNPLGLVTDGGHDFGPARGDRLTQQAAALLTNIESRAAFTPLGETGAMAQFPQLEIEGLNANTDQVVQMLGHNRNSELFDALVDRDRTQAADFAVHNSEIQTHALHEAGDEAFRQDVRMRLTGSPAA